VRRSQNDLPFGGLPSPVGLLQASFFSLTRAFPALDRLTYRYCV